MVSGKSTALLLLAVLDHTIRTLNLAESALVRVGFRHQV